MFRNHLYYGLKPFLPASLRFAVRRWFALRKLDRVGNVWPILKGSETPPQGWPGWPDGKQFALVLTHDVEGPSGLAKIPKLMELDRKYGFCSSFNLIPEGNYQVTPDLRKEITANGFEVGVHDLYHDGKLFQKHRHFNRNAAKINQCIKKWGAVGFRAGFMLHNLDWIHSLNVEYDASTFDTDPFEPQPHGQRTIFPFWVPRPSTAAPSTASPTSNFELQTSNFNSTGYVELPYTLPQDSTLFLLLRERHPDIWIRKLDWIAKHGGMALLNVHPDYIRFEGEAPGPRAYPVELYTRFLEYAQQRYAGHFWQPLPREVSNWCRPKSKPEDSRPEGRMATSLGAPRERLLNGKRGAVVLYSGFPSDPRPRRELEALCDEGMDIDLICLREDQSDPPEEIRKRLRVTRLPMQHKRSGKIRYFWQYAQFFLHSFFLLTVRSARRRYDLVHVHNMPDFLVFTALVPRLRGARVILDLHDPMPELYRTIYGLAEDSWMVALLKRMERWSLGFADLVLTPNEAFRQIFSSRSCPAGKIHIIMNTPDEKLFCGVNGETPVQSSRNGSFRIMYHGLIAERHGLHLAVKAISELVNSIPGIRLDIYGSRNPYLNQVEALAQSLGLSQNVKYCGKKRIDDIPDAIRECDLGIIPNLRTPFTEVNFPTRIFEYLSLGKPVIVPETRGITDYFPQGNILYFRSDTSEELARVLRMAYVQPAMTAQTVEKGLAVYRQHLWSEEKKRFQTLVSQLISAKQ